MARRTTNIANFARTTLRTLPKSVQNVYSAMRRGNWVHSSEVRMASGVESGLRRMRELRQFFTIEKRRNEDGTFDYRIVR